jgi:hypothetical protein
MAPARRWLFVVAIACLGWPAASPTAQVDDVAVRRDAVLSVLRAPAGGTMGDIARTRGTALGALPFDALPIAHQFLGDDALGGDAAYAMLGADEPRALQMIFGSIPDSGPNIQRIAFTWYLDRYTTLADALDESARGAALRTLAPVRSTANAEAALYVLGLAGSSADFPVLEFHLVNYRTGSGGMRNASHAALIRLGSQPHLERLRDELARTTGPATTYQQGVALTLALQKAAFAARAELVPGVCAHVQDAPVREIDIGVDPARSAQLALNAIVDKVSVTHLSSGTRTAADWATYCAGLSPGPVR